jgi:hypothetical protein
MLQRWGRTRRLTHGQTVAVRVVHLLQPVGQRVQHRVLEVRVQEFGISPGVR